VSGLTSRSRTPPAVFALDLNCAIYHCVRKIAQPYTHDTRIVWEDRLIQEVLGYIKHMTSLVNPTTVVYIAVDGVAPMAKIKQQRCRRFKSSVLAAEEAQVKAAAAGKPYIPTERWDTNAITPGTAFMDRLAKALHGLRIAGKKVLVSAADEAGEGEQKIMSWLRTTTHKDVVVYGLDADLIVLALLEHARTGRTVDLFREETEFGGGVKRDALGEEQYLYLNTGHLAQAMWETWAPKGRSKADFMMDYVGIMNLMGNDFVPHGMALKINDEGIEHVLEAAKTLPPLIKNEVYVHETLVQLLETLATQEERWMLRGIRRKLEARTGVGKDAEAQAMARMNDRPVEWAAEKVLVEQKRVEGQEKPTWFQSCENSQPLAGHADSRKSAWFFRPAWRSLYSLHALEGSSVEDACREYASALCWTLRYYIGHPVDMNWYYPWHLPPLLGDLVQYLKTNPHLEAPTSTSQPLKPVEQLAMVLPRSSFALLPHHQDLPDRYPWAWPTAWSNYSLGRRFLWECEPLIPLIQVKQIQAWMK
jgi:5'-3' exoribonuclease 2